MIVIILGKPLVFWLGLVTLASFIWQLYLGYGLTHGRSYLFTYHRLNAAILASLVLLHLIFGFLLYF